MITHFDLGGSSANRWLICHGSVKVIQEARKQKLIPVKEKSNKAADEGSIAHGLGETCLEEGTEPELFFHKKFKINEGDKKLEAFIDESYIDAVKIYVDYIRKRKAELKARMLVEYKSNLKDKVGMDCGGATDCALLQKKGMLEIVDYKHGKEPVEVKGIFQLRVYALGVYFKFAERYGFTKIKLTIVQPRIDHKDGPIRSEVISPRRLLLWYKRILVPGVEAIKAGSIQLVAGKTQCKWCRVSGMCKEKAKHSLKVLKNDFENIEGKQLKLDKPDKLTKKEVELILDNEKSIRKWLDKVSEHALAMAKAGEKFTDKKLVRAMGNRTFKSEKRVVRKLKVVGIDKSDLMAIEKMKSPAMVEKYLISVAKWDKKEVEKFIRQNTDRPDRGVHLVNINDRRKEIDNPAIDDFKDIPVKQKSQKLKTKKVARQ